MLLAEQPVHQRFVRPGPLVLGSNLLKSPTPTADRDRTVSRRSEPRSRTALMGEQPNPWDQLQPQDATIRHRACYPSFLDGADLISSPCPRLHLGRGGRRLITAHRFASIDQQRAISSSANGWISRYGGACMLSATFPSDSPTRYCPRFHPRTRSEFTVISRNF